MCQSGTPLWNIKQETSDSSKPSEVSYCVLLRRVLRRRRPLGQALGVCCNPAYVRDKKIFLGRAERDLDRTCRAWSSSPADGAGKASNVYPVGRPIIPRPTEPVKANPRKIFLSGWRLLYLLLCERRFKTKLRTTVRKPSDRVYNGRSVCIRVFHGVRCTNTIKVPETAFTALFHGITSPSSGLTETLPSIMSSWVFLTSL